MIWLPSIENILLLHQKMAKASGGSEGIRELGLIESAIARAAASFAGVEAHPGVVEKAAAIGCGLTQNHGFIDGNKRIGMAALLLILRRNGLQIAYTQDELIALGLAVAQGKMDVPEMVEWVLGHQG